MPKGVTRPEEVAHLGLSNRLLARIGALLKKKLALSLALLESATAGSAVEALLLHAELLQNANTISAEQVNTLKQSYNVKMPLAIEDDGSGFRVLCLQEELEADAEWGAPTQAAPLVALSEKGLQPSKPGSVLGAEHLAQTLLKLATASSAAERIEALRVLLYAPLSSAEKAEAILQALSDGDEAVRAEAAGQLPGLGVSADISAALVDLNRGETAKRMAAAERLDKLAAGITNELEDGALLVCVLPALKGNSDRQIKVRLLSILLKRAATLGRNPRRLGEVLRAVTGMIAAAAKHGAASRELEEINAPSLALINALGCHYPADLLPLLQTERAQAADAVTEAFLLLALFESVPAQHPQEAKLLEDAASYLARDIDEGRDSRAIGSLMAQRGGTALEKLCGVFANATPGAKRHLLILLDEMCRKPSALAADFMLASAVIHEAMDDGSKALRMSAMECRLVCDPRVPPERREKLARAFLDSASDFSFSFDIDKVESAVARMGAPAVAPLLERLDKSRAVNERSRAARLLGELALNVKAEPGGLSELQNALSSALRRLEAVCLETDFPGRGEVLVALGKVIASPAATMEANDIVARTLLTAAKSPDISIAAHALEGAAYLAASRRAQAEFIAAALNLLKEALSVTEPEQVEIRAQNASNETVFDIQGGERYALILPVVLRGLERVALAPNTSSVMTREIGRMLLERWRLISHGKLIWGPANNYQLISGLRNIALNERSGTELRGEIVTGLAARLTQTPVMHAISEILAADDIPQSGGLALSAGFAMLKRRDAEGRFDDTDRPDILQALARIVGRKFLYAPVSETEFTADALRRTTVQELIKAAKDNVTNAVKILGEISVREAIPKDLRDEIERRLKARQALVKN